jgi:hypothetical protein
MVRSLEGITKWDNVVVGGAAPGFSPRTKVVEKERKTTSEAARQLRSKKRREEKGKRRYGRRRPNHPRTAEWQKRGRKGKGEGKEKEYQNKQEARKEKKSSRGPLAEPKRTKANG